MNLYIHRFVFNIWEVKKMNRKLSGIIVCSLLIAMAIPFTAVADTPEVTTVVMDPPSISIETPQMGNVYVMGAQMFSLPFDITLIIGPITVRAAVTGLNGFEVDFYIDGEHKFHDSGYPFEYPWWDLSFGKHTITVELTGYGLSDSIEVFKIF
jgi:hypothetical protein